MEKKKPARRLRLPPADADELLEAKQLKEEPRKPRKIACIGKAPDSIKAAPFADPEWEVWVLNTSGFMNEVPRWDRQFEIHDLKLVKDPAYGEYYGWLTKQERPVFLRDSPPAEFKNGVQFPLTEYQKEFERLAGRNYITNTVSWMIVLALLEHRMGETISDIGFWGINMAQHGLAKGMGNAGQFTSEYARQRPSCEYWIGVAEGMGIQAHVAKESDILKCACLYGYHTTAAAMKMKARRDELQGRVNAAENRELAAHDEKLFLAGALEGMGYDQQWMPGGEE